MNVPTQEEFDRLAERVKEQANRCGSHGEFITEILERLVSLESEVAACFSHAPASPSDLDEFADGLERAQQAAAEALRDDTGCATSPPPESSPEFHFCGSLTDWVEVQRLAAVGRMVEGMPTKTYFYYSAPDVWWYSDGNGWIHEAPLKTVGRDTVPTPPPSPPLTVTADLGGCFLRCDESGPLYSIGLFLPVTDTFKGWLTTQQAYNLGAALQRAALEGHTEGGKP